MTTIEKIKAYRAATGCGLKEAHDAIMAGRDIPAPADAERERDILDQMHDERKASRDRIAALEAELATARELIATLEGEQARADALAEKLAMAVEALRGAMSACDQGRMIPRAGAGGMTIDANIKGSIYVGVPAWPIEEARTTLAALEDATKRVSPEVQRSFSEATKMSLSALEDKSHD